MPPRPSRCIMWSAAILLCCLFTRDSLGWAAFSDPPKVHYTLEYMAGTKVRVTLEWETNDTQHSELQLQSEWGGVQNQGEDVTELTIRDANQNLLEVEKRSATSWYVKHLANSRLKAEYFIPLTGNREPLNGNDYRTLLDADSFEMIGYLGLLTLQPANPYDRWEFHVRLQGFEEAGWQLVSSLGAGSGPFVTLGTREDIQKTRWMAGRFTLETRKIENQSIAIAISGNGWRFSSSDLADHVAKIVRTERDFFDDHSDPWYLVTLTPVPGGPGSFSFGGTALNNCFALFCTENLEMGTQSPDALRTLVLLAHEYFHNWNGIKIPTASDDPETYWFSEGFTNFYARRMLHRCGLMTDQQLLYDINSALSNYEKNPHRLAPNEKIVASFWKDRDSRDLPYQRGDMVAILLDEHIRERSQGLKSLDDWMRDFYRHPLPAPITTEMLLARIKPWVDPEVFHEVKRVVLEGKEVNVPTQLSVPKAKLTRVPAKVFDPGFDFAETQKAKKLEGVIESGPAYQAGLRNGQKIQKLSLFSGDHPKAEIVVEVDGKPKTVVYEPLIEGPPIRNYALQ